MANGLDPVEGIASLVFLGFVWLATSQTVVQGVREKNIAIRKWMRLGSLDGPKLVETIIWSYFIRIALFCIDLGSMAARHVREPNRTACIISVLVAVTAILTPMGVHAVKEAERMNGPKGG